MCGRSVDIILLLPLVPRCLVTIDVYNGACFYMLCWIDRVWSSRECTCSACDLSVHISVPCIGFISPHLRV